MRKLFILLSVACLALMLVAVPFMAACAKPAPAPTPAPAPAPAPAPPPPKPEPIVLKALCFIPIEWEPTTYGYARFIERVNERAKGELTIEYVGAFETVPMYDQPEAVRTGVADMTNVFCGMYKDIIPEVLAAELSKVTPMEERENGFYDWMVKLHKEKMNLYYLGRTSAIPAHMYMYFNEEIEKLEDLKGMKFATGTTFMYALERLGVAGVHMPMSDKYSALERGVVDGCTGTLPDHVDFSLYEVTKYFIDHPVFPDTIVAIVNLDKWNSLPEHLQDLMMEVMIELEPELLEYSKTSEVEAKQKCIDGGMEPIHLSPEEDAEFEEICYGAVWDYIKTQVSPESYTRLRELLVE